MFKEFQKGLEDRFAYMQAFADELRGIAFNITNTAPSAYGNNGCEHGRYKIVDDGGSTRDRDADTLNKVAKLFENFWGKEQKSAK